MLPTPSLAMQPNTVLLQFPSSHDTGMSVVEEEATAAAVPVHTKTMQLGGLPILLRSRKRQRQTNAPTPTPTLTPTPPATATVEVSFGLPFFRLRGFHTPTIVNYSTFLTVMLIMWVAYLILPQGLRRYLCNAHRKRYRKSNPNRISQTIGGRIKLPLRPNGQNQNGLEISLSSNSSEHSNASSANSVWHRGNQTFRAIRRGSPQNRGSSHLNNSASSGRSDSRVSIKRGNISQTFSSDLSSKSSSKLSHPYFHQDQQDALEINQDSLSLERNKFISAGSSDLSSVMSTRNDNSNNVEALSSTGSAIWGTPKRFVRKRIADDHNNIKRINDDNHQNQQIDLLTDNNNNDANAHRNEEEIHLIPQNNATTPPPALSEVDSFASAFYSTKFSSSSSSSTSTLTKNDDMTSAQEVEPSPIHPDLTCGHTVPSHMVLSSTLLSFRDPGIRLFAHGTQCEPRRIWIRLDVAHERLSWRTENVAPSNTNRLSDSHPGDLVTLGQVHFIPLIQILFIDVGKTTAALHQLDSHDDLCFSILTDGGSLDLQASNKVERDAFVSCMCLILDTVYNHLPPEKSWRRLNDNAGSSIGSSSSYSNSSGGTKTQSDGTACSKRGGGNYGVVESNSSGSNNEVHDFLPYASSSSTGTGSVTGSDVFHGVDLGSQVSATFGEI